VVSEYRWSQGQVSLYHVPSGVSVGLKSVASDDFAY
jgi:hypothetical protein